jgi:hypothetical protein
MRLTVGPLPAAVYWRRRGVVLVGVAMIVLIVFYAFSGPDSSADTNAAPTSSGPSGSVSTTPVATAPPRTQTSSPSPTASAFTLPVAGATGPCADAEMEVIATAAAAEVTRGQPIPFTIKIKNISSRTCVRDIGADVQELQLKDAAGTIIWSSDDCGANHGREDQQFTPGFEVSFTRTWPGLRSRGGNNTVDCTITVSPDPEKYQVLARLDQKLSAPFALLIKST